MGCQSTKCKTCENRMPACQLIQGYCGTCWAKLKGSTGKLIRKWLIFW